MNRHSQNRDLLIDHIKREIIGAGSDIFHCTDKVNFTDEVIEGKPLQRYSSAILFPKQVTKTGIDSSENELSDDDEDENNVLENALSTEKEAKNTPDTEGVTREENLTSQPQYTTNAFFPSQFGLSFCVSKTCTSIDLQVSFGNYKKAKSEDILLPYNGTDIQMLSEFGFDKFVLFNPENQCLVLKRELDKNSRKEITELQKSMAQDHRNHTLFKHLTKLFFKDKFKRYHNDIRFSVSIADIQAAEKHLKIQLSEIAGVNTETWYKGKIDKKASLQKDHLWLHLKLYDNNNDEKYFIKAVIVNTYPHLKDQFSHAKEKLNQLCLFQTEIKVASPCLIPFNDYKTNLYKSEEDKMLDYLFRHQLAYGIGHNTACTWENCSDNTHKPSWISTTFLPEYDVKSQSTETDKIEAAVLDIRNLSSFGTAQKETIRNLQQVADAYLEWIKTESAAAEGNEFALKNIEKCEKIYRRICNGIALLAENPNAFRAFQLANTAIYLQMFQNEAHFSNKKDGYEIYQRNAPPQYNYADYQIADYPNHKPQPAWRPFQLAFILQCIPSFVEENCEDTDLVDLLYFPTGGGKTEAYLAVSAFLIFWRRLQYPKTYGGVNVIIRYTLRLLSAQQFERATKLILACEYIRQNHQDLGSEKITIGFWVGDATIANTLETAQKRLTKAQNRLNEGKESSNPFQLTNCQWCNTKIISKDKETDNAYRIGHRINNNKLHSSCLNPQCHYHNALPIVVVDEDIYNNPPTILFATVDKFAQLAWKEEATQLFNYQNNRKPELNNRKPELIIQDELHLLNGPLGSLVGLFENVVLPLCTTAEQRPKIIASTATVKNVEKQIEGLYGRQTTIFPQYATNADDTFFSKTQPQSKRRYLGILPTGKTTTLTSLRLNAAFLLARLAIWQTDKQGADAFWTILSYFKSLKEIGRFANKITAELQPEIQQLQVRYLKNYDNLVQNYRKLPYRNFELTSRIANEKIKKNLDKLDIAFDGNLDTHKAFDIVLATNMISVGLDVRRLNIMLMNGMPPNTAEYIQASSRVARNTEGVVVTLFDPNNTRDLSYFEDFVPFHKTFYKQVEPLSVTPFAENALDKMLFTVMVAYFRHKLGFAANNMATALITTGTKQRLASELKAIFDNHIFASSEDKALLSEKIDNLVEAWEMKIQAYQNNLFFKLEPETKDRKQLLTPIQEKNETNILVAMQSMRSVEPSSEILIKQY